MGLTCIWDGETRNTDRILVCQVLDKRLLEDRGRYERIILIGF
jgi:hypothetical protein